MNHELHWPEQIISEDEFLSRYWQKKPLFIKNAFPDIDPVIDPDELAGLALEQDIESRIVFEQLDDKPWVLNTGPFTTQDFKQLPETHWTLLVQDAEKHVPVLHQFMHPFRFIPDWRMDDLMISFAPKGGSVGPHTDHYDVFLLQTQGSRRWQVSQQTQEQWQFRNDTRLCVLNNFLASEEWIAEPGDLLYLPPNVPHFGVALDDCMTYSIGFRAPSGKELLDDFAQWRLEQLSDHSWFTDPNRDNARGQHAITAQDLKHVRALLNQALDADDETLGQWFGELVTRTKPDFVSKDDTTEALPPQTPLERNPASRFAWLEVNGICSLFVDGETAARGERLRKTINTLCAQQRYDVHWLDTLDVESQRLVTQLYQQGHLWVIETL